MVRGCLQWLESGLQTPEEVKAATKQYRSDMDVLGEFIDDCCIEGHDQKISCKDLYDTVQVMGRSQKDYGKEKFGQNPRLAAGLKERGFVQVRD